MELYREQVLGALQRTVSLAKEQNIRMNGSIREESLEGVQMSTFFRNMQVYSPWVVRFRLYVCEYLLY